MKVERFSHKSLAILTKQNSHLCSNSVLFFIIGSLNIEYHVFMKARFSTANFLRKNTNPIKIDFDIWYELNTNPPL